MENTNQKTTIDTHTKKKKQPKHKTKDGHQITSEENKRGKEEKTPTKPNPKQLRNWQQNNISIITLNVNGLNAQTKRLRLTEWIQKQGPIQAVYKKPTSDLGVHTD